jgi:hypothetical protein
MTAAELEQVYHAVISLGEHRRAIGDGDLRRIVERVRATGVPAPAGVPQPETVTSRRGV